MVLYGGADPFELIKHMTLRQALDFGLVNKEVYEIIKSDRFWRYFIKRDYPYFVLMKDENPQVAYRKIYNNKDKINIMFKYGEKFSSYRYYQNIQRLYLNNKGLKSLVGCPPCIILNCNNNQLEDLKGCPENVIDLHCNDNYLTSLEYCPDSVVKLLFSHNRLTTLYGCGKNVEILHCNVNKLISLDGCSKKVTSLLCTNNSITKFDIHLPYLKYINYVMNPLVYPWDKMKKDEIISAINSGTIDINEDVPIYEIDDEDNEDYMTDEDNEDE
jgi:hypothetical protein